jgi:hypothetical protein
VPEELHTQKGKSVRNKPTGVQLQNLWAEWNVIMCRDLTEE